jgi:hypothetical protein
LSVINEQEHGKWRSKGTARSLPLKARQIISPAPPSHIAIQEYLEGRAADWMEHVSDEQYIK